MVDGKIPLLALRTWQLLCACVVLGTGVVFANWASNLKDDCKAFTKNANGACDLHGIVPESEYSAFVGAWGLIESLLGIASIFIEAIPWIVMAVFDGLGLIFWFAGAVAISVWLSDYHCDGGDCSELKADVAFLWMGFLTTIALFILGFFWHRNSGRKY